jgi:NADP-dependent 3-hydroxy acid dehydrogenase YdfG
MSGIEQPPDIPRDVIDSVWATNVTGVMHMTQAILPIFKRRPDGGKGDIIFLGSIAGREPYVGGTVSSAIYVCEGMELMQCSCTVRVRQPFEHSRMLYGKN